MREVQLLQCSQDEVVGGTQHPTHQTMHLTGYNRGKNKCVMLISFGTEVLHTNGQDIPHFTW